MFRRTQKLVFVLAMALMPSSVDAQQAPELALEAQDPAVHNQAVRLRVTNSAWDYLRLTLRDTFKIWGPPGASKGGNLLLEPGYDTDTASGGLARWTPTNFNVGPYTAASSYNQGYTCSNPCGTNPSFSCKLCPYTSTGNRKWVQSRRPGFSASNTPTIPYRATYLNNSSVFPGYPAYQGYGFYVAAGAPPDPTAYCPSNVPSDYYQLQICTNGYNYDVGGGESGQCPGSPVNVVYGDIHYNLRVSIHPNMRQEYALDPVDSWNPPNRRGPFAGYTGRSTYNIASVSGCQTAECYNSGTCNCNWLGCDDGRAGRCNTDGTGTKWTSAYQKPLPGTAAAHDANASYDWFRDAAANSSGGMYFREGDKQSLYANIYQMQIHSVDRSSAFPSDCEFEVFYTGKVVDGKPEYKLDNQKVANCMRPLMYYDTTANKWTQCDAFDTWNTDLTYNLNNDDAKRVYPGHPSTGLPSVNGSPTRTCGAQPCTGAYCGNPPSTRRTTNKEDLFNAGGGWHMFNITKLDIVPGTNTMDLQLRADDLRVEVAVVGDVKGPYPVGDTYDRRFSGRLRLNSLVIDASVRLFSIDETSCNPSYPPSCGNDDISGKATPWQGIDDGKMNPDQFLMDVKINSVNISRETPTAVGDQEKLVNGQFPLGDYDFEQTMNDLIGLGIRIVGDEIEIALEDTLRDMIAPALQEVMASIPNLNSLLGNPMAFDRALIDTGLYLFGDESLPAPMNYNSVYGGSYTYPKLWPVVFQGGSTSTRDIVDLRISAGFKPVAFKTVPGSPNPNLLVVDTADPPLLNSVYGVPTLMNPVLLGSKTRSCPTPGSPQYAGCSREPVDVPAVDEDQEYDNDDYCLPNTVTGSNRCEYEKQEDGTTPELAPTRVFPEHWEGPILPENQPPSWCLSPAAFRADATPTQMNSLYPKTNWLSFDATYEKDAAGTTVGYKNTRGGWDTVPGSLVLKQNFNDGTTEDQAPDVDNPAIPNVPYDFSLHVHQRTIAEFMHAIFASGLGCIELSDSGLPAVEGVDTGGLSDVLGTLLSVDRFAMFMPELPIMFPGGKVKIQISPTKTPHVRTGISRFTPDVDWSAFEYGGDTPLPIVNEPYTLGIALPDLRVKFLVVDSRGDEITLMTTYWSPVLGFYIRGVRQCLAIDALSSSEECTSKFKNVRTVSGYNELFVSLNDPQVQAAFDNVKDATTPGHYTVPLGDTKGSAHFVITENYCDQPGMSCDAIHLADSLPMILSSYMHMLAVTRLSIYNFTIDLLFVGPDGPNNDGVGLTRANGGGDYLGIYANFLGSLDVFGLIGALGGTSGSTGGVQLAPGGYPLSEALQPKAAVSLDQAVGAPTWFASTKPRFPIELQGSLDDSAQAYTWRVDKGFWNPPSVNPELELPYLTQGEHELEVRAIEDSNMGSLSQLVPTSFKFRVDTLPPKITLSQHDGFFTGERVVVEASDLQTEADELVGRYRWDTGAWRTMDGASIDLSEVGGERHRLVVRVSDLAGNVGEATINVRGTRSWWGCQAGGGGYSLLFAVLLPLLILRLRRRSV